MTYLSFIGIIIFSILFWYIVGKIQDKLPKPYTQKGKDYPSRSEYICMASSLDSQGFPVWMASSLTPKVSLEGIRIITREDYEKEQKAAKEKTLKTLNNIKNNLTIPMDGTLPDAANENIRQEGILNKIIDKVTKGELYL
jgi:hypothetical protein